MCVCVCVCGSVSKPSISLQIRWTSNSLKANLAWLMITSSSPVAFSTPASRTQYAGQKKLAKSKSIPRPAGSHKVTLTIAFLSVENIPSTIWITKSGIFESHPYPNDTWSIVFICQQEQQPSINEIHRFGLLCCTPCQIVVADVEWNVI